MRVYSSYQAVSYEEVVTIQSNWMNKMYRQFSNIRRTESPYLNVSRLILQLSLPNPLKPGVKLKMKM